MKGASNIPPKVAACPGLLLRGDGPVFAAPWQAQIFALVVALHEGGRFPWKDFHALLIEAIGEAAPGEDAPEFYYRHWLRAAEKLFQRLDVVTDIEITARADELAASAAAAAHHHR